MVTEHQVDARHSTASKTQRKQAHSCLSGKRSIVKVDECVRGKKKALLSAAGETLTCCAALPTLAPLKFGKL